MHPSAFRVRGFRLVTQARFLLSFSVQLQAVVMGWQIYELTRDPLYLGLIGLTEALPALGLALFAGDIVDRSRHPLTTYRRVVAGSLLSALILLFAASGVVSISREGQIAAIYLAAFVTGVARSFAGPAMYKLIPQLISREALQFSSPWLTASMQIGTITGPAIGGLLYGLGSGAIPYAFETLMLGAAAISLSLISVAPIEVHPAHAKEPAGQRITSGLRFVFSDQLLVSALALDMFAVLFGGVTAILPVFVADILHEGPAALGLLRGSSAAGALLMSLFLIRFPVDRAAGKILLAVVAGFGFSMIGFALSRDLILSMIFLALGGGLDSVSMVIRGGIVQLRSPDHMRGRIAAVNSIFIGSSNEIGAFESGIAAKILGTVPSVIFGGCMTLLTVVVTAIAAPKLRQLKLSDLR